MPTGTKPGASTRRSGELLADAAAAAGRAEAALALAERYGHALPLPGRGETLTRWRLLADLAAVDLTVARVFEAHTDALAILAEAGAEPPAGRWGVFAAEGPGVRLDARHDPARGWMVHGTKPWCSLAADLDAALVTAHVPGGRALFAVSLQRPGVRVEPPSGWVARGLREVPSGPVHFDTATATAVGNAGWYLHRPGFAWGGIGVAACWYGGARALAQPLLRRATGGGDLDRMQAGAVDVALHAAWACLQAAAADVDAGRAAGRDGELLALRVRSVIAAAVEETIARAGRALGPAPLAFDEEHARRVADLQLYVRQHHGERDLAALGAMLTAAAP